MCATGVCLLLANAFARVIPFSSPLLIFASGWQALLFLSLMPWARFGDRGRALIVVGYGALGAMVSVWQLGPVLNAGVALLLSVLLGGVLLSRRAAVLLIFVQGLFLLSIGLLIDAGLVAAPSIEYFAPTNLGTWLRVAVVFTLVGGGVVFALLALVAHLDRTRAEALRSVEALQREQEERRRLEGEHEAAERAVAQAQHLESIGRFAGGVAHDFNNVLTVIIAGADELRASDDPHTRELVEEILTAARSAGLLTKQLLAVGRRDLSRPVPTAIDFALGALEKPMRRVLPDDVVLTIEAHAGRSCLLDPSHFQQIMLNLILNARDAMPRGGRLVITSAPAEHDGRDAVRISVADSGAGMTPEVCEHIFEPFFTTKEKGRGTGLGLASVYGMVQRASGEIVVESGPERGTVFHVVFPAVATAVAAAQEAPRSTPAPRSSKGQLILVAEDQVEVRIAMCRALRSAGYVTIEASDGDEALRLLREHASELSLFCTDAIMPGRPLAEVFAELRRLRPSLPVLLCSGYVEEELVRRDLEAGRGAFLEKPFTPEALLSAVEALARQRGGPRTTQ